MADVGVHYNSDAPRLLHAHAYTRGAEIHIAPGRERDLAHEAWHAVQQKQGRARPTDAATSISDDPALEREADRMGAAAFAGLHDIVRLAQPFSGTTNRREVVQRKKVTSDFGVFETKQFTPDTSGVTILLTFDPDEAKVDASKIAFVQSVKATDEAKKAYAINPTMAGRMVKKGKGKGYTIDASGDVNNPLYFNLKNLGSSEDLKDTPKPSASPVQVGVNTHYDFGYCYKINDTDATKTKSPAAMFDQPEGIARKGAGMTFETTALAIDGVDRGTYYGSVKWGYVMKGTAAALTVAESDIELASAKTPTANFIAPAKLWNLGTTRGDLVVNPTAPGNTKDAYTQEPSGVDGPRLKKGTKLKLKNTLKGSTEPMIEVEVLDGTNAGDVLRIYVSDVKDLGGGDPNKKLPEK